MATKYSRPAIEFQRNLRSGMRFVFKTTGHALSAAWIRILYGEGEITVNELLKETKNPDDCLYSAVASNGHEFECRAWWLRQCCDPVTALGGSVEHG